MNKKSSKNQIIIIAILVLVAGLIGFSFLKGRGTKTSGNNNDGVFGSIKDAISKSLSLKCEYKVGENTTIAYVKGSNVRIEGSWQDKNNSAAILKENKMWTWDTAKKEGIVFSFETEGSSQDGSVSETTSEGIVDNLESQKQYCKVAVFSDSVFTPPTDVKFQDLSNFESLMKNTGTGE